MKITILTLTCLSEEIPRTYIFKEWLEEEQLCNVIADFCKECNHNLNDLDSRWFKECRHTTTDEQYL